MKTRSIFLALSLIIFVFSPARAATMSQRERETDRPGCDTQNFIMPSSDPTICENTCGADPNCSAWNLDTGRCYLKNCAPPAVAPRAGQITGVKVRP